LTSERALILSIYCPNSTPQDEEKDPHPNPLPSEWEREELIQLLRRARVGRGFMVPMISRDLQELTRHRVSKIAHLIFRFVSDFEFPEPIAKLAAKERKEHKDKKIKAFLLYY
jgi:hypothetical protein